MANETGLTSDTGNGENLTPIDPETVDGHEADSQSLTPPEENYKDKFSASSKEAQRLYQENLKLQGQIQAMQQHYQQPSQPAYHPPQPAPEPEDFSSRLSDAILDKDTKTIKQFENHILQTAERRILNNLGNQIQTGQRIGNVMQYVLKETQDEGIRAKSMQRYNQMMYDPSYASTVPNDMAPFGNIQINPHLMRLAVLETKAIIGGRMDNLRQESRTATQEHVESSQPVKGPSKTEFDPRSPGKYMTKDEIDVCKIMASRSNVPLDQVVKKYWDNLDDPKNPGLRAARLKEGKPISQKEFRS